MIRALQRIVVMGNSGAGKSTLAHRLSRDQSLAHLDLDTLAWEPTTPPTRAPLATSAPKIDAFIAANPAWVIEGCYADLLAAAARHATLLIFLDPGVEVCIENCRRRPWEPHKYPSREAQDANLEMLIAWIRNYDHRTDELSRAAHQALFDGFRGDKRHITEPSSGLDGPPGDAAYLRSTKRA